MIRILIVNSTLERSGVTNVIYNLCKYLNKADYDIHILTLSKENGNSRWNDFAELGIHLHSVSKSRFLGYFQYKNALQDFAHVLKPDVIHTFSYRGTSFVRKYLSVYKRMVTIEADLYDNYSDVFGKMIGTYIANKELKGFTEAHMRVVCSHTLAKVYENYKVDAVIQNGVDVEVFYPVSAVEKNAIRKELNLPLNKRIFISVGSLIERKDPLLVISGFLKSIHPHSLLLILGNGPLMDKCKTASDSIVLLGNVTDVDKYLKASDVFISASHSEGLPNTVIEAALCGLKCILSDIPQHREIFDKSSDQVVFFEIGNGNALSLLINGEAGFKSAQKPILTAKKMSEEYSNLYNKLAGNEK